MIKFRHKISINFAVMLRVVGWLLVIESAFMLIPLTTAIIYNDESIFAFAFSSIITLFFGVVMFWGIKLRNKQMGKREAIFLTTSVWLILSIFGAIPFIIAPPHLTVSEALFESVSGFTTTGSSVITDIDNAPHGILMWRSLTQWIGGVGIIILTLAVLPMLNSEGGINLFNAEVSGITHDKLHPRINQTAKDLCKVYFIITIIGFTFLSIGKMPVFDAVCHILSAVSTGGFSTKTASVMAFDSNYIETVLIIVMILGGTNFALIYKFAHGDFKSIRKNDTFRWYLSIILIFSAILSINLFATNFDSKWYDKIIDPVFQVVSILTTTGFASANYELWGNFAVNTLVLCMLFGACAGSTTGAFKIDRIVFLAKTSSNEFYKILHPNNVRSIRVNGQELPFHAIGKVLAFAVAYLSLIATSSLALSCMGIDNYDAYVACSSSIGNVGLGAGITGFNGSWAQIPAPGLWILTFLMIAGRLEIFTLLILFTRSFWSK